MTQVYDLQDWKKKFTLIWTGQTFSILTSSIAQFALVLWIGMETGSAKILAYATIAGLLPQILIGPFAGVFVDRWNKKWTMIASDSFVAICSAVIALLFYFNLLELWSIYLLLALRSIGGAFHSPAMKSTVPTLAPKDQLVRIAGINEVIQSVSLISGPALGAFLLLHYNMSIVMLLDVVGAGIACIMLLFVSFPKTKKATTTSTSVYKDMMEGGRIILKNKPMSWLLFSEIIARFFIFPVVAVTPLVTLNYYKGTPYQVSLVEMLFGVGLLVGGGLLALLNQRFRKISLAVIGYIVLGLALLICGSLSPHLFVIYAILTVVQGIAVPLYEGSITALIQTQFESKYLGRIFGLIGSICQIPAIIGLMFTAELADRFGVQNVYVAGGIALCFCAILVLSIRRVREL
ncbi:MFS transporter [Myroides sp. 1354]|uniref:MFS transporter n=1 Tax=unclassified Myroides TaxID=2642485 RepID=UPI0025776973|nr:MULTISPECIES: MFS transporter [unclassified Myroides]MDM1044535.1 MFS transporter [Myroides sp. R163-1]MDM1057537.1 MFS transporter [Myroides sp. 1354]MDM1070830.1 MFS transporter [Myroides sp. 1372]